MTLKRLILASAFAITAGPALAHTGAGSASGFAAGLAHPMSGLDHILAMSTVGLIAALVGGRAVWAVPATFLALMLAGGVAAFSGIGIPAFEIGIAASVFALGALVAFDRFRTESAALGLAGLFAVFHGYAHIVEMPATMNAASYAAGFVLGGALLLGQGLVLGRVGAGYTRAVRLAGVVVAATGLVAALH